MAVFQNSGSPFVAIHVTATTPKAKGSRAVRFFPLHIMAAGSRKKFALDLTDIMSFPDGLNIPICPPKPGESWVTPPGGMKPTNVHQK